MIKFDESSKTYNVSYSLRPSGGGSPVGLRRKGIKTHVEAKRVYAELIILVNEKLKKQKTPTWKECVEGYLKSLEASYISKKTQYNREKVLSFHTMTEWESRSIDEISREEIYELLNTRFQNKSEEYRKYFIKSIRGVFQYALEQRWIDRNPTPLLKFKIKSKIKSVLNEDQILTLLRSAQEQNWSWYPHYSVALFTGMRNGELYALQWSNVNLEKRQILVNCSWGNKDGFKSTKSGDDRIVEIPNPLMPLLKELKLKSENSDFVLPRLVRWDRGEQAYDLRLFLRANGLPEVRFHDLRASWATLLLDKDVPPSKVMSMGGWSDLKTMMIYMRKAGINIKDSTKVLDSLKTHDFEYAKVIDFREM